MFKVNDEVRVIGEMTTGIIENIIEDTALVRYPNGKKKVNVNCLVPPLADNSIRVTPEKYDEAVKGIMYGAAEAAEDDEQLNAILEVIAAVCSQLKARLFNGD